MSSVSRTLLSKRRRRSGGWTTLAREDSFRRTMLTGRKSQRRALGVQSFVVLNAPETTQGRGAMFNAENLQRRSPLASLQLRTIANVWVYWLISERIQNPDYLVKEQTELTRKLFLGSHAPALSVL